LTAAVVDFHYAVISCDLARRGERRGEAAYGYCGKQRAMNGSRRGQCILTAVGLTSIHGSMLVFRLNSNAHARSLKRVEMQAAAEARDALPSLFHSLRI